MTWWDVEPLAKVGVPVRRTVWPTTKSVVFSAGAGTERAVAVLRNGASETVLASTDFALAEFTADDWMTA